MDKPKDINAPAEDSSSKRNFRPEDKIEAIWQEIYMLGANDSEHSQIEGIKQELKAGGITEEEAVRRATAIRESKQDYH